MTLRYTVNGARFRRHYVRADWRNAIIRARVLISNGIAVAIKR